MSFASFSRILQDKRLQSALIAATGVCVTAVFISRAWVGEDAYITFRTIDNFVNGHGLRWNVDERVQSYTHPLWLLVVTPFYFFTREIPYTVTSLCLVFGVGAYVLAARHFRHQPLVLVLAVFVPYVLSESLVLWSTSGFENPLTLFLVALFVVTLLSEPEAAPRWGMLSLLVALAGLNRLDSILLLAPALAFLILTRWKTVAWKRVLLGLSPVAAWLVFSLFYYGFLFPNTAYAKLSRTLPQSFYLESGIRHLANLFMRDLPTAALLSIGSVCTLVWAGRWLLDRGNERAGRLAALGAGSLLSGAYVIWIGGDFLLGRFWVGAVFVALIVAASTAPDFVAWLRRAAWPLRLAVVAALAGFLLAAPAAARSIADAIGGKRIWKVSIARTVLQNDLTWGHSKWARNMIEQAHSIRGQARRANRSVVKWDIVGLVGMTALELRLVDTYGLVDPLIARLSPNQVRKAGHMPRSIRKVTW